MKAVIVVEPAFLRPVEDGKVEIVLPDCPVADIVKMKKRVVDLLEDERPDVTITISFPGSPKVEIIMAEKVQDVVPA